MRYLTFLILLLFALPAQAQGWGTAYAKGEWVRLYKAPRDTAQMSISIQRGTPVEVVGKSGHFYKVKHEGNTRYVLRRDLTWNDDPGATRRSRTARAERDYAPPGRVNEKDPATALLFSILIPGGGHLYAGETGKGSFLLVVGMAAPTAGLLLSSYGSVEYDRGGYEYHEPNLTPMYVGVAAGLAAWIYGIADAGPAVERHNEQFRISARPSLQAGRPALAVQVEL